MFTNALTSITIGLLATTSPCVFPLYPGYLAYLSGGQESLQHSKGRYLLGFLVLAGVLTMMVALGGLIAALAIPIGSALAVVVPLADALIFALGILLLLDKNPFKALPTLQAPVVSNPYFNAYIYGLLYGPIALPCSGPLVVSIFAISLSAADAIGRLTVFLWFGLGFGLPLLALSFLAGATQRWITRQFALHSLWINRVAGLLLVGIGIIDFVTNWPFLKAAWF